MHGRNMVAAGKLTGIHFDDRGKTIEVAAKIVDDNEWMKVEDGVYSGFSIGGRYLKRWADGDLKRYTASPSEISLVDLPANPAATFSMLKANGIEELRKFHRRRSDDPLIKAASAASTNRWFSQPSFDGSVSFEKRAASLRHVDASRSRIEFGTLSVEHGEIMLALDHDTDTLHIHGIAHPMASISTSIRRAIRETAARFSEAAQDQTLQWRAKTVLAALIDSAMTRDQELSHKVRERIDHLRYRAV